MLFRSAHSWSICVFRWHFGNGGDRASRSGLTPFPDRLSTALRLSLMKSSASMPAQLRELRGEGKFA
jgi:hypothetical protein